MSPDFIYSVIYVILALCLIAPPVEFVSIGLTIQNLFSSFLGSEEMNFIFYHIKRTTCTYIFHSIIPLGYYGCRYVFVTSDGMFSWYWLYYLLPSVLLPFLVSALCYYWSLNRWDNHPIAQKLAYHAPSGSNWRSVASSINIEFRRIDKFSTGMQSRRLFVTDNWLLRTSTYTVHIAHQSNIHLNLSSSDQYQLSNEGVGVAQYINITVQSINTRVKNFDIRLNALEYSDLRDKLSSPIVNARNIVIHQSIGERFVAAFEEQVQQNEVYHKADNEVLESCIGCMMKTANVKLRKQCDPDSERCVSCYCRPMWCLQCMGKWFASRQNQQAPETWLAGVSPCPTCRSPFCLLDVCMIP